MSDLISRQAAIDLIRSMESDATSHGISPRLTPNYVINGIESLPPADRPIGKWELIESEHVENIYLCSHCRNYEAWGETEKTPYCPHCGAWMEV